MFTVGSFSTFSEREVELETPNSWSSFSSSEACSFLIVDVFMTADGIKLMKRLIRILNIKILTGRT